jgi:hypothetical protein
MLNQDQLLMDCRPPRAMLSAQGNFILCVAAVCIIVSVIVITSLTVGIGLGIGLGNKLTTSTSG